jgi:hypothetical protein
MGFPLQSFTPLAQPHTVSGGCTLLAFTPSSTCTNVRSLKPGFRQAKRNRYEFCEAPEAASPSGCCSTRESATANDGLDRRQRVALVGFAPPGCSPSLKWPDLRRTSPHGVTFSDPKDRKSPLQGISSSEIGLPLSRLPTLLGFVTS